MNNLMVVEKPAHLEKLKALVRDSVSSPITKRVYNMALNEVLAWCQQVPQPGFTKATVSAWRVSLEDRCLGSSSIISAGRRETLISEQNNLTFSKTYEVALKDPSTCKRSAGDFNAFHILSL